MRQKETESTIEYYNKFAEEFIQGTINSDMSKCYAMFLAYMKQGQTILDLGCGSGRDSKIFIDLGFEVVSIDGSPAICKEASKYIGKEVICNQFEELSFEEEFDGIWASASLLHVNKESLPSILRTLSKALKKNGYLYASFKYGNGERIVGERLFNDYSEKDIDSIFNINNGFKCLDWRITEDVRITKKGENWLNIIAEKVG